MDVLRNWTLLSCKTTKCTPEDHCLTGENKHLKRKPPVLIHACSENWWTPQQRGICGLNYNKHKLTANKQANKVKNPAFPTRQPLHQISSWEKQHLQRQTYADMTTCYAPTKPWEDRRQGQQYSTHSTLCKAPTHPPPSSSSSKSGFSPFRQFYMVMHCRTCLYLPG